MPTFQDKPTVSVEDLTTLLEAIHDTFNTKGKINIFQINRIASNLISSALFTALRTTNAHDGFESKLITTYKAAYGIAKHFRFTPNFDWNIDSERDKFFTSKVPTEDTVMKKLITRLPHKYGITDTVTATDASDTIMELEFSDVTELDEKWNDTNYKNDLRDFMRDNKDEVNDIRADLNAACKENKETYSFKMLTDHVSKNMFVKPEPVTAFERLKADAQKSVAISLQMTQEIWDKVQAVISEINLTADFGLDTLSGTDGLNGVDRYRLVQSILRNFDWSQKDCNDKLGEIVADPRMENMEKLHESNLNGALAIIPMCNTIIERADEVYNSNTLDELSRMYEEGSSDNLSDDKQDRHDYEVEKNLPHGTVGA